MSGIYPSTHTDSNDTRNSDVIPQSQNSKAITPVVQLNNAQLSFGERVLWRNLDLDVQPGEFLAVLGPNGSGKTSLLEVLLGNVALTSGSATIEGEQARRGAHGVSYIPQQRRIDPTLPLRARDFVRLGLDGQKFGFTTCRTAKQRAKTVNGTIKAVDATTFADSPMSLLSGGEQQRIRAAQALVSNPRLLLCDEPLLSLDLTQQHRVIQLIHNQQKDSDTAVLFVTHEISPILPIADRILYLANGNHIIGTPDEVLTSSVLSELYQSNIHVVRVAGRVLILGEEVSDSHQEPDPHHAPDAHHAPDTHRATDSHHATVADGRYGQRAERGDVAATEHIHVATSAGATQNESENGTHREKPGLQERNQDNR